jgi:formylglycine-generating enzyme required for sulfatase activity
MRKCPFCILAFFCAAWSAPPRSGAQPAAAIRLVEIRAAGDSFIMGDGKLGPGASLSFTYDLAMSRFPVTNAQFAAFIANGGYSERSYWTANGWKWKGKTSQPAYWKEAKFNEPDQPVVGVSWYEAAAFCNWLSMKEGRSPAYDGSGRVDPGSSGYRLPTEAEWEYAAAKGAPGQVERIFPWGDAWNPKNVVCRVSSSRTAAAAPVGSRSPQGDTPQGISDMAGNVWEWCSDNAQSDDEVAGSSGADRYFFEGDPAALYMVLRGGSWWNDFTNGFRAAFRSFSSRPDTRNNTIGFRVVRR